MDVNAVQEFCLCYFFDITYKPVEWCVQKKVTFPHWSKKFSALFWVLSTSLSCAESSPSIRKGNSCSIWLWKSKFHVQKIIPCPCSPLFWISVFLWKFLNSVGPHGPTSFRNFHKNTSNQKRGELVQGKLFCTVTFLFHTSNWAGKVYSYPGGMLTA